MASVTSPDDSVIVRGSPATWSRPQHVHLQPFVQLHGRADLDL